ncbi:MAG: tRNA (adenosine(37)-N6)-dimethylallyltransferase MiaA [Candidatus Cryptobacteroides sp.]|nr:tRNA (adenosine(37)-N6)-dimethylallyltransferase MiaA [Candidatus Cryptobacteroides sp.]
MPRRFKPILAALPEAETVDPCSLASLYSSGEIDLVCVLGPTASGKTRYAVNLARSIGNAEILSADSRQVYKGMDIGTGKDLAEYGEVPVHLIDLLPAGADYNVCLYQRDFARAYSDIRSRGAFPILCGGTGLYINAVTSGYDFKAGKPLSESGESYVSSPGQAGLPEGSLPRRTFFIGTLVSREERNARIDRRLEQRLTREGLVQEIERLLTQGVPAQRLIAYGLEYKYVTQYVLGELSYDEMFLGLSTAIHQFAKRQMTWFRGLERSGIHIHWVEV